MTRVFLVDDHELLRRGVRAVLETDPELTVVGEAATAREALARIPAARPDVVILDVRLPDGSGVEVCRDIRSGHPEIQFLILTGFVDDAVVFDAIMAGAAGYVLKDMRGDGLADSIRRIADGQSLLDPAVTKQVLSRLRKGRPDPLQGLTEQERHILDLIGQGLTNRQIAHQIHLAEKTVKNYVSRLLAKLGMEHRVQAALYVARADSAAHRD
jgi:two-component system response regulator DevR